MGASFWEEGAYIVARHSPQAGLIEPLAPSYSAHKCTRGQEIGIRPQYATRASAAKDAARLERHVNEPACIYRATLVAIEGGKADAA